MAKLTLIVVLVYAVYFVSLKTVVSQELEEDDEGLEADERSGRGVAHANARVTVGGPPRQTPFIPPGPGPVNPTQPMPIITPGVECYVCTDCPKVLSNTTTKLCPKSWDVYKDKTCVTYVEKYNHLKRPWYIRGCASERGNCKEIKQAHSGHGDIVKLVNCYECQGDKCNANGAYRSLTDTTVAFFVLIVTPLVGKYTLS